MNFQDVTSYVGELRVAMGMQLSFATILARLSAASVLTMLIGWERETKNKPAGLRTHMLVGTGAATFYLIFIEFVLGPLKDAEAIATDPTRIFEGIVTGIGFLGAGAIIQGGSHVRGLTTGAAIWVAGGIGLACGGGYYAIAGAVTFFALIILHGFGWLERRFIGRSDATKFD